MKKGFTEIVFILDRSGSMAGLESDTIGGYNAMIEKQKKEEGEACISTILFDDKSEVLHNRIALEEMKPMTDKEYYVRGCTALLDAVGGAIHHISQIYQNEKKKNRPEHTIFIITTDGLENASREYSYDRVKKMIDKKKKKHGWEFLFLGANMDAVAEAGKLGIHADHTTNFVCDEMGTAITYRAMGKAVSAIRCANPLTSEWKEEAEADFETRGK